MCVAHARAFISSDLIAIDVKNDNGHTPGSEHSRRKHTRVSYAYAFSFLCFFRSIRLFYFMEWKNSVAYFNYLSQIMNRCSVKKKRYKCKNGSVHKKKARTTKMHYKQRKKQQLVKECEIHLPESMFK